MFFLVVDAMGSGGIAGVSVREIRGRTLMSEVLNNSELELLVMLLISGGVVIFLVGLFMPISRSHGSEMRGIRRRKPVMPVGLGLCTLGLILGFSWDIL